MRLDEALEQIAQARESLNQATSIIGELLKERGDEERKGTKDELARLRAAAKGKN